MKIPKILIADDFMLIRMAWKSLFKSVKEYQIVAEAKDGFEVVEICGTKDIDVVLMDITMPGMNGIEATRRVIEMAAPPRIIGLSMHSEVEFVEKMFEAGASAYLTKDVSFTELCIAIDSVMRGEQYVGANLKYLIHQKHKGL